LHGEQFLAEGRSDRIPFGESFRGLGSRRVCTVPEGLGLGKERVA